MFRLRCPLHGFGLPASGFGASWILKPGA